MKYLVYVEEQCGARVVVDLKYAQEVLEEFFHESDPKDKLHFEIVEMSEAEFKALPESWGC